MLTMLRMSGRCSINYRWLRLHLSGTEPTIEAPGASFLQDEIPICPFSFRRAKAPCPDRTRCRRRPNAIGTFWKLRNGVECIGKKPLAITDARKPRRLSGVTTASSVTLSSHALTIAAKRKWRLPSKRSIGCVSSVGRSSFASHDHEAKGRMPSPRASMQQGFSQRTRLLNALRGHLTEVGVIAAQGPRHGRELAELIEACDEIIPFEVCEALAPLVVQLRNLDEAIARLDRIIAELAQKDETARRLMSIPGFGPITASAMAATIQDTSSFAGPRDFAAFLGLTPKQNSSGGKQKLGSH